MPYKPISSPLTGRPNVTAYDMVKDADKEKEAGAHKGITTQVSNGGQVVRTYNKDKKVAGWRVAGFHVLNFITAGFAGAVGSLCAKSQAMGSQKAVNSTRHFGELYNAATYKTKNNSGWNKTLKTLANIWSFPAHAILSPARLLQNALGPDMCKFRAQRGKEFGKSRWFNFSSVHGINANAQMRRKEIFGAMHDELKVAYKKMAESKKSSMKFYKDGKQPPADYVNNPTRLACSSGSPSLRKAMLLHSKSEWSEQHVLFLNWSSKVLDKADPSSPNYQEDYRISKREMLDAYENFIKTGSEREINIDSNHRHWAQDNLNPDEPSCLFGDYKQRLKKAEAMNENFVGVSGPGQIPADELEDNLVENLENETFSADETKMLVKHLKDWDNSVYHIEADSVSRLRNKIQQEAGVEDDE